MNILKEAEQYFEVRIKKDRKVFCRHVSASSPGQAASKCVGKGRKRKGKIIIGVRKLGVEDIIGRIDQFKQLRDVIGKVPPRQFGIIDEDTTLDSIVFKKKYQVK